MITNRTCAMPDEPKQPTPLIARIDQLLREWEGMESTMRASGNDSAANAVKTCRWSLQKDIGGFYIEQEIFRHAVGKVSE
ncbi:MAG TPA: hypothetical protein VL069_03795 [Opitutus sp.]|nr:hypothetical protein [Opitutus sp.]